MNQHLSMFGLALLILLLITAAILGLMAGPTSPLTWLLISALLLIPALHRKFSARRFIQWKEEYSVGIASIDHEHRRLVNLMNQVQTAVDYSTGEAYEREALDELVDYTKTHFAREEALMSTHGYPDFENHKAQHHKMINAVETLLAEYEEDHDRTMQNTLEFLKDWLIKHINGTDKQYSSYLIAKGVT